jgi:hypothetical protein
MHTGEIYSLASQENADFDVRIENAHRIEAALQLGIANLLEEIDFDAEPEKVEVVIPIQFFDKNKHLVTAEMKLVYISDTKNNPKIKRVFGIFIAKPGDFRDEEYNIGIDDLQLGNEFGFGYWRLKKFPLKNNMEVRANVATNPVYEGLGIGRSLLYLGENAMEKVAIKLARHLQVPTIESIIVDGSKTQWTERRANHMRGYVREPNDDKAPWKKQINVPMPENVVTL